MIYVNESSQKVTWKTNEPATSQVEYSPRGGGKQKTPLNATLTTEHSVLLIGLEPHKFYDLTAISRDAAGNEVVSLPQVLFSPGPSYVPTANDADGDGIPNQWEKDNGLDQNNAADAVKDADKDGLSNLSEYKGGSNPQKKDTDGDGMPDGWERANGLLVTVNDAGKDPDKDDLNNLKEYKSGTDPNVFNKLSKFSFPAFWRIVCEKLPCSKIEPWCPIATITLFWGYLALAVPYLSVHYFRHHRKGISLSINEVIRQKEDDRLLMVLGDFRANIIFFGALALAWFVACSYLLLMLLFIKRVHTLRSQGF